jgi:hypothetical protein
MIAGDSLQESIMLPRRVIDEYRSQSFSNLQQGSLLALHSVQDLTSLYLDAIRVPAEAAQTWLSVLGRGGQAAPKQDAEAAPAELPALAERYSGFLQLIDAQLRLSGESVRSLLAEVNKWTPRPAEVAVSAVGLALDAVQLPAEALAAFAIAAAKDQARLALAAPAPELAAPPALDAPALDAPALDSPALAAPSPTLEVPAPSVQAPELVPRGAPPVP